MTTFSFPVNQKIAEPPGPEAINLIEARVPARYSVFVNTARTGTAVGATAIPLFVAPAGAAIYDCVIDVVTPYDNNTTNLAVGVAGSPARLHTAVTVNTGGRRTYAPTPAQISANAIPLTANTTVVALVSIDTSAVTAGSVLVHVQIG